MVYPSIQKQPIRTASVPILSGGVNYRDGISGINDNQLLISENMWFKNGTLKTRNALSVNLLQKIAIGRPEAQTIALKMFPEIKKDGKILATANIRNSHTNILRFWWQGNDEIIELPSINFSLTTYFVIQKENILYCFLSSRVIYKLEEGASSWAMASLEDTYAPLVATNCLSEGKFANWKQLQTLGAVQLESYNLISPRYRMEYSTAMPPKADGTIVTTDMVYSLLHSTSGFGGKRITVKYTDTDGKEHTHTVTLGQNEQSFQSKTWSTDYDGNTVNSDNRYIFVGDKTVMFVQKKESSFSIVQTNSGEFLKNNMIIEAPFVATREIVPNSVRFFGMRRSIWFGSAAEGINGGSRLFLCGNENKNEKNTVIWSDTDNPLYFPESNFFKVGNDTEPVTGFGLQGENLVIFKKNEIYQTCYVQSSAPSPEDLESQAVIDVTQTAYFPLIHVHSNIGCDLPDTIQLCRNRLVWCHTNGRVYTLVSQSQYNERNVYEVSEMISSGLKNEYLLTAKAVDFDGYYILFCGTHIYLMDYNSYGYTHIYGYSKTEDANQKIPWWYWSLPKKLDEKADKTVIPDTVFFPYVINNKLGTSFLFDAESGENVAIHSFWFTEGLYDTVPFESTVVSALEVPIESKIKSKLFDFGAAAYNKNIQLFNVVVTAENSAQITVYYSTDSSDKCEESVFRTQGKLRNIQLRPNVRNSTYFGFTIESKKPIDLGAVSINYRLTGGSR